MAAQETPSSRVYINVGGCIYETMTGTLRKSSKLKEMLDHLDEGEELFVDRDGMAFAFILNFLRNNTVFHLDTREYIEFLISEAAFYGLRRMESQLTSMVPLKTQKTPVVEIRDELRSIRLLLKHHVEAQQGRLPRPNSSRDLVNTSANE